MKSWLRQSLRQKILGSVCALTVLSLLGSTISLYRITEVNRLLDVINRVSVPLGRLFIQMQSDADIYHREVERTLGAAHWKDPHWRARPAPKWIVELLESQVARATELIKSGAEWNPEESRQRWQDWSSTVTQQLADLKSEAAKLQLALEQKDEAAATRAYARWSSLAEEWKRQIQWGTGEYDRTFRATFSLAESRVSELRTGLEMILVVVVSLSLLLLWLGERALRPLNELTRLARDITRGGLKKEHKSQLPDISLGRTDEVSQLAREFHRMATALLEREKTVETQNHRLQEQNAQLRAMGELQERLQKAEHMAAIGRMSAQVAHEVRNPLHSIGLEAEMASELASRAGDHSLKQSLASILASVDRLEKITENYLRLSKLSNGRKGPVDLADVLMSVLATYAPVCEAQRVFVDWKREEKADLVVWGDRDLLEQVLGNLFRNSLQALEGYDGGRGREKWIRWSLASSSSGRLGQAWVRIEDNGPGIQEEIRAKLFDPFFTTRAQGTGLGLSFVKRVMDDHEGAIHLLASESGTGARFELVLPSAEARLAQQQPQPEVSPCP